VLRAFVKMQLNFKDRDKKVVQRAITCSHLASSFSRAGGEYIRLFFFIEVLRRVDCVTLSCSLEHRCEPTNQKFQVAVAILSR
jgi:hypothetical protein